MKKQKDEVKQYSEEVKGNSIPADEIIKESVQKKIKFNKNKDAVPATPEGVKQEKKMVDSAENENFTADNSTNNKFIGIHYHEFHIDELQQKAREMDLNGRSKMNKEELINALYEKHTREEIYDIAAEAKISGRSKMSKSQLINELRNRSKNTTHTKQSSSGSNSGSHNKSSNSSKDSSSNTSGREYYKLTKEELYEQAKKKNIEGRSNMDKEDLLEALYEDHTREELYEKAQKEDIKGRSSMSKRKLIKELQTG